jgi:HTH-type transcriptional regulator, sugar sensing transcriptional regulator
MNKDLEFYKQNLLALGLSERETNVYISILYIGKGTVTEITRKAGINRTTGYDILDSLVSKGFVSISGKRPKQEYAAESPEKIIAYLENQQIESAKKLELAKQFIPQLTTIHNVETRPKIRFYEGVEGLKEVYEDTLQSKEDLRSVAYVDEAEKTLEHYFPKYYQRRAAKNISIRAIFPDSPAARNIKTRDHLEKRHSVILPGNEFDLKPEINVYDNKVMIASWSEQLGIIIESQDIANAIKLLFELAWKESLREDISDKTANKKTA